MRWLTFLIILCIIFGFFGCDFIGFFDYPLAQNYIYGQKDDFFENKASLSTKDAVKSDKAWFFRNIYLFYQADKIDNSSPTFFSLLKMDAAKSIETVSTAGELEQYEKFSIIILPDTQNYTERYPQIFTSQIEWIAEHKEDKNIVLVLHVGDLVNNNNRKQWEIAARNMKTLNGIVPYVLAVGNHDMDTRESLYNGRDTTLFNKYFPVDEYEQLSTFGGMYEEGKLDNSYHLMRAGGLKWLVLSLEFCPRDEVLAWANIVVKYYNDYNVILLTHSYLYSDDKLHGADIKHKWGAQKYAFSRQQGGANNGIDIWGKLVRKNKNICFVFCGHILNDGLGRLVSTTDKGNQVYQMLANYQNRKNGGNGYLRIMEVDPRHKQVSVTTYSPYLDEYYTDTGNQFQFRDVELIKSVSRN